MGVVLAAMLGACGAPPAPVEALPTVSYDGHYQGQVAITGVASGADKSWCDTAKTISVDVVDNAFVFSQVHPNVVQEGPISYEVAVARDGTFRGESDVTGIMSGKIDGTTMTGVVDGIGCAYSVNATRTN